MKAIILVGGFGTRLRPLTFSCPKPLVPFCNIPIVTHQIEALVKVGVKEIILAVNVQPDAMLTFLKECEKKYGITIHCSLETEPMGTAGPLALARELLTKDDSPFFMFNSDVICEYPLQQLLDFHRSRGAEGTLLVTEVEDPSKYGVVISDENGCVERFVEKPKVFVSNKINAGMYLLETKILDRIELRPTSIEREVFPAVASDKKLFSMVLPGYWMDIGQPKDYLVGTQLHLNSLRKNSPSELATGSNIRGNVLIHPSAQVSDSAVLGPDVVIGENVVVGEGARLKKAVVFEGSKVNAHALVANTVVGWKSNIGSWSRVTGCTFGEDVTVGNEVLVNDSIVCPHKEVKEDVAVQKILL